MIDVQHLVADRDRWDLPYTQRLVFDDPQTEGECVQFRLLYRGPLPSASNNNSRVEEKCAIRRQLHPQLQQLWQYHPALLLYEKLHIASGEHYGKSLKQYLIESHNVCNFRFLPLVTKFAGATCSI